MDARILDLDGSLLPQHMLAGLPHEVALAGGWGPRIRLGCSFGRFRRFENALARLLGSAVDERPKMTFYGSGDFHHVSLALLRRLTTPFNLLVLDNHPDWMRGLPFLHCGTWLGHASRLPLVRTIYHFGGHVDFDNHYRWLAPWRSLRAGKIAVFPAFRRFQRGPWARIAQEPVRPERAVPLTRERLEQLLAPHRDELARWPLYISLDKDVMVAADAPVNWDSGRLTLDEVTVALQGFRRAAAGNLAGMDIVGDWSPLRLEGWFRRVLDWLEHPSLAIEPVDASARNEYTNRAVLAAVLAEAVPALSQPVSPSMHERAFR